MKQLILMISLLTSFNAFAAGSLEAIVIDELKILSITVSDDVSLPPYEGGKLWTAMKGVDQRKYLDASGFTMECDGITSPTRPTYGACTITIELSKMTTVGDTEVFKVTGSAAAKLNRFFIDSAYVDLQGGDAYLSSYNTRREFTFGIKSDLIQRYFGQH